MKKVAAVLLLFPSIAAAEISDKVNSAPEIVLLGIAFAVVGYVLAAWRWWLSAVGVVLAVVHVIGLTDLFGVNGLRDALWAEMPKSYFATIAATGIMIVVATAIGGIRARRRLSSRGDR